MGFHIEGLHRTKVSCFRMFWTINYQSSKCTSKSITTKTCTSCKDYYVFCLFSKCSSKQHSQFTMSRHSIFIAHFHKWMVHSVFAVQRWQSISKATRGLDLIPFSAISPVSLLAFDFWSYDVTQPRMVVERPRTKLQISLHYLRMETSGVLRVFEMFLKAFRAPGFANIYELRTMWSELDLYSFTKRADSIKNDHGNARSN